MSLARWHCFAPFRDTVGASLEVLRRRVFADREFASPAQRSWDAMSDAERDDAMRELLEAIPAEQRGPMRALVTFKLAGCDEAGPANIEELLTRAGPAGTRSVLDITEGVADAPTPGAAAPMPHAAMRERYGTVSPTRSELEAGVEGTPAPRPGECWFVRFSEGGRAYVYFEGRARA